jgi:hypothetical protein
MSSKTTTIIAAAVVVIAILVGYMYFQVSQNSSGTESFLNTPVHNSKNPAMVTGDPNEIVNSLTAQSDEILGITKESDGDTMSLKSDTDIINNVSGVYNEKEIE